MNKAKVLIIDDEQSNVRLLERILELVGGIHVKSTTDSRQALPLYQQFHPDLILLDLHMPHLDGFAVMDQLKTVVADDTYLPILVLTADITSETKRRALSSGANDFVTKPLDHSEVLLRIKNLLEIRFLHLQLQMQNILLEEQVQQRTEQLEETLAKLRATQQHVIKQERLGALGVMAGGIAHDFNNQLTMILGYSELLLNRYRPKADREELDYLQNIVMAAQDATQIVARLQDFHRPTEKNETRLAVDLNKLIEQAVSLTLPKWKDQAQAAGIQIVIKTELGSIPEIAGDAAELREVLTNMIFNSVDALPQGGEIEIKTSLQEGGILVEVSDNGVGMSEEVRQRCLEPFFTTKGDQGTGLGLSVIYGIVHRHGGAIDIQSELGKGTRFQVKLPAITECEKADPETERKVERSLRILLVDDQPVICQVLLEHLVKDTHVVDTASDGAEALTKFREHNYDLVITDHAMPGMNGEQLASAIKEFTPPRPVILLTGYGESIKANGHQPTDIDLIVSKPITISELRRAIVQVVK